MPHRMYTRVMGRGVGEKTAGDIRRWRSGWETDVRCERGERRGCGRGGRRNKSADLCLKRVGAVSNELEH
jgi:hypothetical protein